MSEQDNSDFGLEDTFGSDFAEQFERERQSRIQSRQNVTEEAKMGIANAIVNEQELSPQEPMMQYQAEGGVTHDVLLMTLPDPQNDTVWTYLNELQSGAVSLPMDYMGDWMSTLFNEKEHVKKMEPGEEYIVIGELDQWTPEGSDEPQDQLSPARAALTLEEVKEYAQKYMDGEMEGINDGSSSEESADSAFDSSDTSDEEETEEEEPETEDEEEEDGDSGSAFGSFGSDDESDDEEEDEDDETDVQEDKVVAELENIMSQKPEVEDLEEGDDELQDVALFIMEQRGYEEVDEDVLEEYKTIIIDHISDDEEKEEEDDGGLVGDDSDIFSA